MGIEDLNGILKNIAADKKQQIRDAIVDGRISEQDAKKIGLSGDEQRALNEAFARGEVLVDDLFVKNLGEEFSDGRAYQLTHTGTRKNIKVEGSPYYAVYELNHNTREATVKFYDAMSKEINEQEFAKATGLEPNAKYGVKDGYLVKLPEQKSNGELLADFAAENLQAVKDKAGQVIDDVQNNEFVKGVEKLAALGAAGAVAGAGTGAAVGATGGSFVVPGLGTVAGAGGGAFGGAIIGAVGSIAMGIFASCEPAIQQNVELDITLKANSSLSDVKAQLQKLTELTESMLDTLKQNLMWQIKNGASLEAILDAFGANNQLLDAILNELMKGNQLLQDIRAGMETNNKQNAEILKVTVQILQKLTNIENSVNSIKAKFPDLSAQLTAILNAIKNNQGGQTDPTEILAKLDKIVALLEAIANSSKVTEATTKAILDAINKLSADQAANFVKVINAINNLGNKLTNLQPLLDEILEAINNNTKNDDKNAQLILDAIANLKLSGGNVDLSTVTQLLKDIKDMFSNCLGKFNTLLAKLENYHGDIVDLLNKILDAIKNHTCNCNCGNGSHEGILDDIGGLIS